MIKDTLASVASVVRWQATDASGEISPGIPIITQRILIPSGNRYMKSRQSISELMPRHLWIGGSATFRSINI